MQRYAERTIFWNSALRVSFFISISDMGAIKQILFSFLLVFVGEIKIP